MLNIKKLKQEFPNGYRPPVTHLLGYLVATVHPIRGVECGEFVRLVTGYRGSSLTPKAKKLSLVDKNKSPQIGDIFVQTQGQWGHIGIVVGVPNEQQVEVVHANSRLDQTIRWETLHRSTIAGFGNIGIRDTFRLTDEQVEISPIGDERVFEEMPIKDSEAKTWEVPYREQGRTQMCVAFTICNMIEGVTGKRFSPLALHAMYQSNPYVGSYFRLAFDFTERKKYGLYLDKHIPFGEPWSETPEDKMVRANKFLKNPTGKRYKFVGTRLQTITADKLGKALALTSPVGAVIKDYVGGDEGVPYDENLHRNNGNHAVTLIDRYNHELFIAQDTTRRHEHDDGLRTIHISNIHEAWVVSKDYKVVKPEQPKNGWKERYGQLADRRKENQAQAQIYEGIMRTRREDLMNEYLTNMEMYINAVAYGGYNAHYFKFGRWYAGDVINQMHAKLNNRELPFDLNLTRDNYK